MRRKVTAHTVKIAVRSGVGKRESLQLTDEDREQMDQREAERLARLERIAARQRGNNPAQ